MELASPKVNTDTKKQYENSPCLLPLFQNYAVNCIANYVLFVDIVSLHGGSKVFKGELSIMTLVIEWLNGLLESINLLYNLG